MPDGFAPSAPEIDAALHAARLDEDDRQRTHRAPIDDLPAGTFVAMSPPGDPGQRMAWLLWGGHMRSWSHEGYSRPEIVQAGSLVDVLTPEPIVAVLRAGYVPEVAIHGS